MQFLIQKITEAFSSLSNTIKDDSETLDLNLELAPFSRAYAIVSPLFRCLGIAFKFAEMDYVSKVDDLREASKSILSLKTMMEGDIESNCVRKGGSHTRNLSEAWFGYGSDVV